MNGRLLAKQGLATDHWLYINQIEQARNAALARKESAGDKPRPKWAISSYLQLAQNRRMARLRMLFSQLVPNSRMS